MSIFYSYHFKLLNSSFQRELNVFNFPFKNYVYCLIVCLKSNNVAFCKNMQIKKMTKLFSKLQGSHAHTKMQHNLKRHKTKFIQFLWLKCLADPVQNMFQQAQFRISCIRTSLEYVLADQVQNIMYQTQFRIWFSRPGLGYDVYKFRIQCSRPSLEFDVNQFRIWFNRLILEFGLADPVQNMMKQPHLEYLKSSLKFNSL